MASEQELASLFAGDLQIVIDRLAGLLAQLKSDGPPCFLLPDRCAIRRVSACGDRSLEAAIADYKKATGRSDGMAELSIFYCEEAFGFLEFLQHRR